MERPGAGKELIARAVQDLSPGKSKGNSLKEYLMRGRNGYVEREMTQAIPYSGCEDADL
jgi:hypothetical protein